MTNHCGNTETIGPVISCTEGTLSAGAYTVIFPDAAYHKSQVIQ